PQWPRLTPFAMRSLDPFRPAGPPPLDSAAYAASFRDVRALGGVDSAARTADQMEIAFFWADDAGTATPPGHWNQVARAAARARGPAAAVLTRFFGADVRVTVGSDGLPGVTRSFDGFTAAAREAGRSRIYGGIHWEFDNADGLSCGRGLGEYVSDNFLLPRPR